MEGINSGQAPKYPPTKLCADPRHPRVGSPRQSKQRRWRVNPPVFSWSRTRVRGPSIPSRRYLKEQSPHFPVPTFLLCSSATIPGTIPEYTTNDQALHCFGGKKKEQISKDSMERHSAWIPEPRGSHRVGREQEKLRVGRGCKWQLERSCSGWE